MQPQDSHLSDRKLLLDLDGELSAHESKQVREHLGECWTCRARRHELENTISDFVRAHHSRLDANLPSAAAPRALLKARLAQLSAAEPSGRSTWFALPTGAWAIAAAACAILCLGFLVLRSSGGGQRSSRAHAMIISVPDSRLTPGATLVATRQAVCTEANTKNKAVPVALQRKVFEAYGISGAEPREYELDYLITPALGGADDIHNLWPQSYSATEWNADVKDALEDRLRQMVCDGSLDLPEAQREIAVNWIAAYKKYFQTDQPLAGHGQRAQ
jgi:hypothetical protein